MLREMEFHRKRWVKIELTKSRAKRVIDVYVKMILSGKTNLNQLAQMYRPDSLKPIATLKRFLKQTEVKQMIDKKIDEALKLHGIDMDFVISKRKEILDGAMKKEDYSNANKVLDSFEEKLDTVPKNQKFLYGYREEYDLTGIDKIIDEAQESKAKMLNK
jgi:hypothetical protein